MSSLQNQPEKELCLDSSIEDYLCSYRHYDAIGKLIVRTQMHRKFKAFWSLYVYQRFNSIGKDLDIFSLVVLLML